MVLVTSTTNYINRHDDDAAVLAVGSTEYLQQELDRAEQQLLRFTASSNTTTVNDNNNDNNIVHDDPFPEQNSTSESTTNISIKHNNTNIEQDIPTRIEQLLYNVDDLNVLYHFLSSTNYLTKIKSTTASTGIGSDNYMQQLRYDMDRIKILSKFLLEETQQQQQRIRRMLLVLYEEEYVPLYDYLTSTFIPMTLRKLLHHMNYPSSVQVLLSKTGQSDDSNEVIQHKQQQQQQQHTTILASIVECCQSYDYIRNHIQYQLDSTFVAVDPNINNNSKNEHRTTNGIHPIVQEFCRPLVERIIYHFVGNDNNISNNNHTANAHGNYNNNNNNNNAIMTKIERLPEWLFGYIREYIFDMEYGPWDIICHIHDVLSLNNSSSNTNPSGTDTNSSYHRPTAATMLVYEFVNEIIRAVQYVFHQRNFFRHPTISGSTSKPMYLLQAIEQILQFDSYIQNDVLHSLNINGNNNSDNINHSNKIIRLMDVCIVGDDELLQWWLEREREYVLGTLFDDDKDQDHRSRSNKNKNHNIHHLHRISYRAELFCSLLRSIHVKANIFTFSGPYYSQVAVPLCIQFVDALYETIKDMKYQLLHTGTKSGNNKLPSNHQLATMIDQWIELINGTHMAATILTARTKTETNPQSENMIASNNNEGIVNEDMARFGRSIEHLQSVLMDEFITTVVETMIMERAKFASYLMRCSHLLTEEQSSFNGTTLEKHAIDISNDLMETCRVVAVILSRCWIVRDPTDSISELDTTLSANSNTNHSVSENYNNYASRTIRDRLLAAIAEKVLEVALDIHGMTPDLYLYGCTIFANDVVELLSSTSQCKSNIDTSSIAVSRTSFLVVLPEYVLRVLDIVKFMGYESGTLRGIGNALCGLSGQPAPLTEDIFSMDDKLYDEATSMIRAKGFLYLDLSDVLTILNRRRDL